MDSEIKEILTQAKELAKRYINIIGKPVGITGEVAEFTVTDLITLELAEYR